LTGLRFIAALSVVMSHALTRLAPYNGPPSTLYTLLEAASGVGMPLFFVLSGFVIHYNYSQLIQSGGVSGIYKFFVARFARLYPLYIVAVAFDLMNSYSYYQPLPALPQALPYYLTLTQSWLYLVLGSNSIIYSLGPISAVAWSVSTEWFFYIAYIPLCFLIVSARSTRTLIVSIVVLSAVMIAAVLLCASHQPQISAYALAKFGPQAASGQDSFFRWLIYFAPYTRVSEFILGCLTAAVYKQMQVGPVSASAHRIGLVLIGVGAIWTFGLYFVIFGFSVHYHPVWMPALSVLHMCYGLAPGLALIIFACAQHRNAVVRFLSSKWMVVCGEASYSLYIWHVVIIEKFGYMQPNIYGDYRIAIGCFMRLAFCIAACIGLSIVSWAVIEVPARNWLRAALSRPSIRVRALAAESR
jgi:peptidoglycan/LPS O-acetylase OafA/YrhL